ncbi:Ras-related protein Rab-1D, partial [Durusdinium trenchii]
MPEGGPEGSVTSRASSIRQQLRKLLHERGNGSLLRAWRSELDPDFSQNVSLEELQRCAVNLGLLGGEAEAKTFFESASSGGVLTLLDVDKKAAVLATRFKRWASTVQPGPRQLFFQSGDSVDRSKVVPLADFAHICRKHGFEASDVEMAEVFGFCDVTESMGGLRSHDLLFLEPDLQVREQE